MGIEILWFWFMCTGDFSTQTKPHVLYRYSGLYNSIHVADGVWTPSVTSTLGAGGGAILFPIHGPLSLPNLMGGGDLDGDDYMAIHDEEVNARGVERFLWQKGCN